MRYLNLLANIGIIAFFCYEMNADNGSDWIDYVLLIGAVMMLCTDIERDFGDG